MVTKNEVQKISAEIIEMMQFIADNLNKNQSISYNKAASQRVRVATIDIQKLFKTYRKLSIDYVKSMAPKGTLKKTNIVIKKKPVVKKRVANGKPKSNRSKS